MAKKIKYEYTPVHIFSITRDKMDDILSGRSSWFLKPHNSDVRGRIALSVAGEGAIRALATLHSVSQLKAPAALCIMEHSPADRISSPPDVMYAFALMDVMRLEAPFPYPGASMRGIRVTLGADRSLALMDVPAVPVEMRTDGILRTLFDQQCAPLFPWAAQINRILGRYDDIAHLMSAAGMDAYDAISTVFRPYEVNSYPRIKAADMHKRFEMATACRRAS